MRALGIDPGLVRTGWAIVEPMGARSVVVAHGVIMPVTGAELPARLADGARQLRQVVAAHGPHVVALEEVFTAPRHPRSALLMAHMRGAICVVLQEAGVPVLELTATTVKQRLTSSGHASKEQVRRMVLRLTGLELSEHMRLDETDAIALALAALHVRARGSAGAAQASGTSRTRRRRALPAHIAATINSLRQSESSASGRQSGTPVAAADPRPARRGG